MNVPWKGRVTSYGSVGRDGSLHTFVDLLVNRPLVSCPVKEPGHHRIWVQNEFPLGCSSWAIPEECSIFRSNPVLWLKLHLACLIEPGECLRECAIQNTSYHVGCFSSHKYSLKSQSAIWQSHFLKMAEPMPETMSGHYLWIRTLLLWLLVNKPGVLTILHGLRLMAPVLTTALK